MVDRLKFIEDGSEKRKQPDKEETLDENIKYPVLARYDFAGKGPRPGAGRDVWMYQQAALLETKGEKIKPVIIRFGWIFLRLAIGLLFTFLVLKGSQFDCGGTNFLWS